MQPERSMPETPTAAAGEDASWQLRERAVRLESVSLSVWLWMVGGVLTVWFCFWLAASLGRIATRLLH
jgi:hypothetical protein